MSSLSPFTISPSEVSDMIKGHRELAQDNRQCYMIQILCKTVYGQQLPGGTLPQSCFKKLPRLINGIPLGAGRLSQAQAQNIQWRFLEGYGENQTFVSVPVAREDAEAARQAFRDRLAKLSKPVFGDITVKCTVTLSEMIAFESDLLVNDIAEPTQDGLVFLD